MVLGRQGDGVSRPGVQDVLDRYAEISHLTRTEVVYGHLVRLHDPNLGHVVLGLGAEETNLVSLSVLPF